MILDSKLMVDCMERSPLPSVALYARCSQVFRSFLFVAGLTACKLAPVGPAVDIDADAAERHYVDEADVEHTLLLDFQGDTRPEVSDVVVGQDVHRVVFEVTSLQQSVSMRLATPEDIAVSFHGENPWVSEARVPVEFRMADALREGDAFDVLLDPGVYTFDLYNRLGTSSDTVTPFRLELEVSPGGLSPDPLDARTIRDGDFVTGTLAFGESRFFRPETGDGFFLQHVEYGTAGTGWWDAPMPCYRIWEDGEVTSAGAGARFGQTIGPAGLEVELIGCRLEPVAYDLHVLDFTP